MCVIRGGWYSGKKRVLPIDAAAVPGGSAGGTLGCRRETRLRLLIWPPSAGSGWRPGAKHSDATDEPNPVEFELLVQCFLADMDRFYPDPVDVFEDELATRLGLERHASLSLRDWRETRVAFIEAHPEADEVAKQMQVSEFA